MSAHQEYVAALTGAGTAMAVGLVAVARASAPTGQRRKPRVRQVLDDASLDELLGPWPQPAFGTPVTWAFRECPNSGLDEPHALHEDGSGTCSCCFTTTLAGGVS